MSLFLTIFKNIWALITAIVMVVSGFQEYPPPENGKPIFHIIDANRELKSNAHLRQYVITGEF